MMSSRRAFTMRSLTVAALAGGAAWMPGRATAQSDTARGAQSWSGWSAYWENDSFVFLGGSDDAFTNGVRLAVGRDPSAPASRMDFLRNWLAARGAVLRRDSVPVDSSWSVVVGQNFFTPTEITTFTVDPADRPYAGLWYVGLRADLTERTEEEVVVDPMTGAVSTRPKGFQSLRQHSVELDVGVLGQGAGARAVQGAVHAAFSTHRIPKGWSHQINNWPALTALYMIRQRIGNEHVDVVPHAGVLAGTVQTYPFVGTTVRAGWHLTGFPAQLGRQTATNAAQRPDWEGGILAGVEGRYFAHNGFVQGPWRDDGPGIAVVRPVGDYRLGFWLRLQDWRLDYTFVRRSPEVDQSGPSYRLYDNYGSMSVSYQPDGRATSGSFVDCLVNGVLGRVLDDFILEAGIGPDLLADRSDGVVRTNTLHVAVGRALPGMLHDFDVAYELVGTGREMGPAAVPGGDHLDRLLINHLATLRWRPLGGRIKWGVFHVRVGLGSGTMELEATPDEPGDRATPCPTGMSPTGEGRRFCHRIETGIGALAGAGYSLDFGHDLGLNTDLSWNHVGSDDPFRFLALTLGFRWAPR